MEYTFDENNIFDLDSLEDLPKSLKGELNIMKRDDVEVKIIKLFKIAQRELNLDEVTVAYYRLYKEERERKYFMTKLYNMSKSSNAAITSVEGRKGVYILKDDYEDI